MKQPNKGAGDPRKIEKMRVLDEACEPGTHLELEVEGNTVVRMTKIRNK